MKVKYILFTFCTMLILSACKKHVVDISPEYEGEWHSEPVTGSDGVDREMYFIIDGEQGVGGLWCELAPLGHNCTVFSGDVKINRKKTKFYIGPLKSQIVYEIDDPPHINTEGEWECTLTERVYIRN